ncbi:MAG: ABC transporter ATP-binding protein [Verrucomicrobiota bacterium]
MAAAIIEFDNVTFAYKGGRPVIDRASFSISERDQIAIIGPNAGGKTTLVKLILGLLTPQQGSIRVFGESPAETRHRVGYVAQHLHFDSKFPLLARDVVLMGRLKQWDFGLTSRKDREAAGTALEQVSLGDCAKRPFAELSGGQRQRVLIARALVSRPEMLLLDEPMANVDHTVEAEFRQLLTTLAKDMLVLVVSHDIGFVHREVRHVVCVNREVHLHPTTALDGGILADLFGKNLRVVRHDHDCPDGEHIHHDGTPRMQPHDNP